jgi:hypothetical protein
VFVPLFTGKRSGAPPVLLFLGLHVPVARAALPRLLGFGPLAEHAPAFARRAQPRT